MPRWLMPVILTLLTASSATLAVRAPGPEAAPEPRRPAPVVPVLSARRTPGVVAQVTADTRLRAGLEALLDDPALGDGRSRSCLVVRQGGRPVFERRSHERLIPASTLKVVTGHAVLARLGPGDRLVTEVRVQTPPGPGGVVDGPLWLVGGGDPLLATADYAASFQNQPQLYTAMEGLADSVVAAGVRQVRGGVTGDETRYDTQRYVPSWKPSYAADAEVGPASALSVNDGFSRFVPRRVAAPVPSANAAAVLTFLLQARGVVVAGPPGSGRAPAGLPLARVASPSMADVVGEMLRESDNLTAELLVKELGHRFGSGGTTSAGLAVIRETLAQAGLSAADLTTVDGSGLDRSDRASCALLLGTLEATGPSGPLAAGLPLAGRDGTLSRRFHANPAAGRLRAKTGSLEGVAGLAGFIQPPSGRHLAFSLLVNDLPRDALGRALQEQVGAVLARYPEAPAATALGP